MTVGFTENQTGDVYMYKPSQKRRRSRKREVIGTVKEVPALSLPRQVKAVYDGSYCSPDCRRNHHKGAVAQVLLHSL